MVGQTVNKVCAPMATNERTEQTAFLLHSIPYRETSLMVDLFTREHGRIAAVAKGARRRHSALRSVLMPFQPIRVVLTGRNELRNLIGAEWSGGLVAPDGDALICSFYMNELLIKSAGARGPASAAVRCLLPGLALLFVGVPGWMRRCESSNGSCCAKPDTRRILSHDAEAPDRCAAAFISLDAERRIYRRASRTKALSVSGATL